MAAASPPDDVPSDALSAPIAVAFTAGDITLLRQQIETLARDYGLDAEAVIDWVTAVNELLTNVVRHGGGVGQVRVWQDAGLICEVRDQGPGFLAADYLRRPVRPSLSERGGMGLWIVQQTTEKLWIDSGPGGTTVRITAAAPQPEQQSEPLAG